MALLSYTAKAQGSKPFCSCKLPKKCYTMKGMQGTLEVRGRSVENATASVLPEDPCSKDN